VAALGGIKTVITDCRYSQRKLFNTGILYKNLGIAHLPEETLWFYKSASGSQIWFWIGLTHRNRVSLQELAMNFKGSRNPVSPQLCVSPVGLMQKPGLFRKTGCLSLQVASRNLVSLNFA
jgi:hypothetical protein